MYSELKQTLPFSNLITVVRTDQKKEKTFPYIWSVCRCKFCAYCHEGKCALKRCCCMKERVKARSCTFTELLQDCFANVQDHIFQFRLKLAEETAREQRSCFLSPNHRKRFYEGCAMTRRHDAEFIAQLFLLSATEELWRKTTPVLHSSRIEYADLNVKYLPGNAYLYYCAACDLQYGSSHTDMRDLSNEEVVDSDAFRMICYTLAISVYGINAIKIAEKRKRDQRGRVKKNE